MISNSSKYMTDIDNKATINNISDNITRSVSVL